MALKLNSFRMLVYILLSFIVQCTYILVIYCIHLIGNLNCRDICWPRRIFLHRLLQYSILHCTVCICIAVLNVLAFLLAGVCACCDVYMSNAYLDSIIIVILMFVLVLCMN